MNATLELHRFILEPFEAQRFANLCGQLDEHLHLIEQRLGIQIRNRGNQFELIGDARRTQAAEFLLRRLYRETVACELTPDMVHLFLQESAVEDLGTGKADASVSLQAARRSAELRGAESDLPECQVAWQDAAHVIFNMKEFLYVR